MVDQTKTRFRHPGGGTLIITLDFELYWGVRDKKPIKACEQNLQGARTAILAILKLFKQYHIHATWATVGFLFFESREELFSGLPARKPNYANNRLAPYNDLNNIGSSEREDPFHYAPSLIKMIKSSPNQEIASHTFSHYYCLEEGQDENTFRDDLVAAINIAGKYDIDLRSVVFPRNQVRRDYLSVCRELGIGAYRGNQPGRIYEAKSEDDKSLLKKGLRLVDSYLNISGHNCYSLKNSGSDFPLNIPASRYLRPYSKRLQVLEWLRLRRILSGLDYAARQGLVYHLWWHPHDFGDNIDKNIAFLRQILDHYLELKERSGMESLNMGEVSQKLLQEAR